MHIADWRRGLIVLAMLAVFACIPASPVFARSQPATKYDRVETQWIDPWQTGTAVAEEPLAGTSLPVLGREGLGALRRALADYRRIGAAGGWRRIPEGERLEQGIRDPRVALIRARLLAAGDMDGDMDAAQGDPELFDAAVAEGVRRFQARNGLVIDGTAGGRTIEAMNVPVQTRIRQLEINLERLETIAPGLSRRYVFVNIAGQEVEAVENGAVAIRRRVIVGKEDRQTPEYTGRISSVSLNPYWNVPSSIAARDMLPRIRANPGYLKRMGIRVLRIADGAEVDPAAIDWSAPDVARKYRLRQDPSRINSLGTVRINFANPFAVYLHDTPVKSLFGRQDRNFSSGCVRVQEIRDLAAWLLKDDPDWSRARIDAAIAGGRLTEAALPAPVPIHMLYLTAWAGGDGAVHFRDDVYGRDGRLSAGSLPY